MGQHVRRARMVASALALLLTTAPLAVAHAQSDDTATTPAPPKKKKPKKPKPPPPPEEETVPPPPPDPTPPPAPPAPEPAPVVVAPPAPPEPVHQSISDVYEKPDRTYYFVGLRYRGDIIPKFMLNLFVNDGKTIYSNSIGAEIDIRRDGFSMIPWLVYTEYGTGDMLFWQKNQPDAPQYYSDVNSSLKSIYAGVDLKWSKDISPKVQFEYGAGFGLGFIFGSLTNDWVQQVGAGTPGALKGSNGNYYTPCATTNDAASCNAAEHNNATTNKVGGYHEKNWFSGGSVPTFFPHISIPEIGIRYKPLRQLETRFGIGFSLTGFFFQFSASYGFADKQHHSEPAPPSESEETLQKPAPPKPQQED